MYEISAFGAAANALSPALDKLRRFDAIDPSTNLHGALLAAISELNKALRADTAALRFANLVVLTDGHDRANRISQRQMLDAVDAAPYRVYTLGIGRELDDSVLSRIGKSGYVRVEESAAARAAFQEIAQLIERASQRYYLLRYCSPARGGRHVVTLEAEAAAGVGQLRYTLDAEHFGAGCDVTRELRLQRWKAPAAAPRRSE